MGFGLWLSRAVMDNHRGSLTLDKDCSDGARFVIEFQLPNNSLQAQR
jgi:K+-sensing histidine kinase KdpD